MLLVVAVPLSAGSNSPVKTARLYTTPIEAGPPEEKHARRSRFIFDKALKSVSSSVLPVDVSVKPEKSQAAPSRNFDIPTFDDIDPEITISFRGTASFRNVRTDCGCSLSFLTLISRNQMRRLQRVIKAMRDQHEEGHRHRQRSDGKAWSAKGSPPDLVTDNDNTHHQVVVPPYGGQEDHLHHTLDVDDAQHRSIYAPWRSDAFEGTFHEYVREGTAEDQSQELPSMEKVKENRQMKKKKYLKLQRGACLEYILGRRQRKKMKRTSMGIKLGVELVKLKRADPGLLLSASPPKLRTTKAHHHSDDVSSIDTLDDDDDDDDVEATVAHLHRGIWEAYKKVRMAILYRTAQAFAALSLKGGKPRVKIIVSGHSLGAAQAQIAAYDIARVFELLFPYPVR